MGKITDAQIIEIKLLSDTGVKISDECKRRKITTQTFYRRLRKIESQILEDKNKLQQVNKNVSITIKSIIDDISNNLNDLKDWKAKAGNQKDYLEIMDREIKYHTSLMKALQSYNDTKSDDMAMRDSVMQELTGWVFDTIQREMGRDKANEIIEILRKG